DHHQSHRTKGRRGRGHAFQLLPDQRGHRAALAPHERFIGAAFVLALKPGSKLGLFSPSAQALQYRYLAFVQNLVDEAIRRGELSASSWWTPHAFWIYYLGILLYWLHDTSPGKQQTLAFLDRSLKLGVTVLRQTCGLECLARSRGHW